MQHTTTLTCPHCRGTDLVKNGHSRNGTQRWRCNKCNKSFQMEFRYNAHKAGIKEKILEYTLNSSGVRDISRILQINKNTVIAVLKKNAKNKPPPTKHDGKRATNKLRSSDRIHRRNG